jgi:flavin reductase (DIM6/NTAB) family NADH-FMN oxidoreductase RutF
MTTDAATALGRVASGLFILTIKHDAVETGFLASWVQQCSFAPLQVSVAVKQGRYLLNWLAPGAHFTLNVLADGQKHHLKHFGKGFEAGVDAFAGLSVQRSATTGAAILPDALAHIDCTVTARHAVGDHELVIADVVAGAVLNDLPPWTHSRRIATHY